RDEGQRVAGGPGGAVARPRRRRRAIARRRAAGRRAARDPGLTMVDGDTDAHAARAQRVTRWLALLCVLVVTHGSLYPWRFEWPTSFAAGWRHMMYQPSWWTGVGDVVGNVVLFMPVGVLGWALLRRSSWPAPLRAVLVAAVGIAFAFALQVVQIF